MACKGVPLGALGLNEMPKTAGGEPIDWAAGIRASWQFGETAAIDIFEGFCQAGLQQYESKRQLADASAVSRLSPYIHFGVLSPR